MGFRGEQLLTFSKKSNKNGSCFYSTTLPFDCCRRNQNKPNTGSETGVSHMRPWYLLAQISWCVLFVCTLTPISFAYHLQDKSLQRYITTSSQRRYKRDMINDQTQLYMMKYGYLPMSDSETGALRTEKQLREAVKTMQRYGNIKQTGILDKATKELMIKPRCGLPDLPPDVHNNPYFNSIHIRRSKRFVKQGNRWQDLDLNWGIRSYPEKLRDYTGDKNHLTRWEIKREIRLAAEVWGRASKLTFHELDENINEADIIIEFKSGYHGDGYPFDGAGMTLAHAFYPGDNIGGDIHFDSDEFWTQHKDSGDTLSKVSLFVTAAHEFGHALGLYHSDVEGALMSPYLIKFPMTFKLPRDDVRGIQELYGIPDDWSPRKPEVEKPSTKSPPVVPKSTQNPRPPPDGSSPPDTCDTSYDAISVIRREIYIFKGRYFWRLDPDGSLGKGYPTEINRFWSALPKNFSHVDAVYQRPHDSSIVFFIGNRYYICRSNDDLMETGPLMKFGLPETLSKIDGAMVWGHNGRTYFFADTMYWRFDETDSKVELDYPRDMTMWSGVPYNIDSVFKFKGDTYFFKGKVFWKFDNLRMKVRPKSPAVSAPFWMGCPNTEESQFMVKIKENDPIQRTSSIGNNMNSNVLNYTVIIIIITSVLNLLFINVP